jgi:acyl-coenzyme A synthetase/AMP-(fatty) acid ligase
VAGDATIAGATPVSALRAGESPTSWPEVDAGDTAVIAFTSGTTGVPKGAVLTHGSILTFADMFYRPEGCTPDSLSLNVGSLSFTGGIIHGRMDNFPAPLTLPWVGE